MAVDVSAAAAETKLLPSEAEYDYLDERGELRFQVVRRPGKQFRQRRPDGNGGWINNLDDTPRCLFRLPQILAHIAANSPAPIYVPEGEKDVLALEAAGCVATTNPGGALKWRDTYADTLQGARRVVVIADRDESGRRHARDVVKSLASVGVAAEVVEAAEGKDASDHLAAGLLPEDFVPVDLAEPQDANSWEPLDLVASALEPPEPPTIGDGLLYPAGRHIVSGEPESGKTWFALVACVMEILAGRAVLWLDFEMGPRVMYERLAALGLADAQINEFFLYLEPTEPLTPNLRGRFDQLLAQRKPSLAVIDSSTPALEAHGLDPNVGRDIEAFQRILIRPLRDCGAAILQIDHLAKAKDTRGRFAVGSERKLGVSDVHLSFQTFAPFGRGRIGKASITVLKDRHGHLPRGRCAELALVSKPDSNLITWEILWTEGETNPLGGFRPTCLMERVSIYLEGCAEPVSRNQVLGAVNGKQTGVRQAMDRLVEEGHIAAEPGPRNAQLLRSTKPFRQDIEEPAR